LADIGVALRTYLDHLAVERGLAANTLSSYRRDLRRYRAFLDESGIDDLVAAPDLCYHAEVVLQLQQRRERGAHERLVVSEK